MTDAMSDVIRYWQRRCGDCARKEPQLHEECGETRESQHIV